jgi:hypothetical protein
MEKDKIIKRLQEIEVSIYERIQSTDDTPCAVDIAYQCANLSVLIGDLEKAKWQSN